MTDAVYTWEHDPDFSLDDPVLRELLAECATYFKKHLVNTHWQTEGWVDSLDLTNLDVADIMIDKYKAALLEVLSCPVFKTFGFKQYRNGYLVGRWYGWLQPYGMSSETGPIFDSAEFTYYGMLCVLNNDENNSRDWAMYDTNQLSGLREFMAQHDIVSYKCRLVQGHGHINRLSSKFDRQHDYTETDWDGRTRYVFELLERGIEPITQPGSPV